MIAPVNYTYSAKTAAKMIDEHIGSCPGVQRRACRNAENRKWEITVSELNELAKKFVRGVQTNDYCLVLYVYFYLEDCNFHQENEDFIAGRAAEYIFSSEENETGFYEIGTCNFYGKEYSVVTGEDEVYQMRGPEMEVAPFYLNDGTEHHDLTREEVMGIQEEYIKNGFSGGTQIVLPSQRFREGLALSYSPDVVREIAKFFYKELLYADWVVRFMKKNNNPKNNSESTETTEAKDEISF